MPKRISVNIDMQILADIALRSFTNREIATKYGVSPSYVSKLSTGKKPFDLHIPEPQTIVDNEYTVYKDDVNAIIEFITTRKTKPSNEDIVNFLQQRINKAAIAIKIYSEIIKNYKGE